MIETLPDIPRLATAVTEWLAVGCYVLVLPRRRGWPATVIVLAAGLAGLVAIQLAQHEVPLVLWTPGMALAVLAMGAIVAAASRVGPRDVGYIAARAFVLAELVASLWWQLHLYYSNLSAPRPFEVWCGAAVTFLLAFGAAHLLERRQFSPAHGPEVGPRVLSVAAAIAIITFALSNLSFVTPNTPFSGELSTEIRYIRTLVDLCGYIALYAQHEQLRKSRADAEVAAMDAMLRAQHDLYLQAQHDAEALAVVRHDLKHQLAVLRAEPSPARRDDSLAKLERTINSYSELYDTGNAVLDTVFTARARHCAARGIRLTCVADGSRLGFVEPMDLASLVGNAFANAIEAVERLEPEERLIRITVINRASFVLLRFENRFDGQLRHQAEGLATRKADRDRHGLGLKSIKRTAAKYGGEATFTAEDNWFTLTILLPVPRTGHQLG